MTAAYLTGLVLGLGLIVPIGAQNVFVFGQGLHVGWPRALWAVVAAAVCDTLLIVAGAVGAAALIAGVPGLRIVLLLGGVGLLLHLGIAALRVRTPTGADAVGSPEPRSVRAVLTRTAMVSLLNPHAILDTVVVIGAAVAAQSTAVRLPFALGTVTASWVWFASLAGAASLLRGVLTDRRRVWFDRVSGVILLVFAGVLAVELAGLLF